MSKAQEEECYKTNLEMRRKLHEKIYLNKIASIMQEYQSLHDLEVQKSKSYLEKLDLEKDLNINNASIEFYESVNFQQQD